MKFVIALMSAGIASGLIWVSMESVRRWVNKRIRQAKVNAVKRGDIPADADLESDDFNLEMYDYEKIAISVVNLWTNTRVIFVILITFVSLTIAWML